MKERFRVVAVVADQDRRAFVNVQYAFDANFKVLARQLEAVAEDADGAKVVEQVDAVVVGWPVDVI